jgi:hypothetical protein
MINVLAKKQKNIAENESVNVAGGKNFITMIGPQVAMSFA